MTKIDSQDYCRNNFDANEQPDRKYSQPRNAVVDVPLWMPITLYFLGDLLGYWVKQESDGKSDQGYDSE